MTLALQPMECPDCAELHEQLAKAERDRDFYQQAFRRSIEAVTAYKRNWWDGMTKTVDSNAARQTTSEGR